MNSLTAAQKSLVNGKRITVTMTADDATGKICDVKFKFLDSGPFRYVPIEIYRQIELDIKSQIWFNLTPEGKKFNYVGRVFDCTIKFTSPPQPEPEEEPRPPKERNPPAPEEYKSW